MGGGFQGGLLTVLMVIFIVLGALVVPYCVFLGFKLAAATDANKRREAKKRMFNALASLLIIVILVGLLVAQDFIGGALDDNRPGNERWTLQIRVGDTWRNDIYLSEIYELSEQWPEFQVRVRRYNDGVVDVPGLNVAFDRQWIGGSQGPRAQWTGATHTTIALNNTPTGSRISSGTLMFNILAVGQVDGNNEWVNPPTRWRDGEWVEHSSRESLSLTLNVRAGNRVIQGGGNGGAPNVPAGAFVFPIRNGVETQGFSSSHQAIDVGIGGNILGTPIQAVADGVVITRRWQDARNHRIGWGWFIVIRHNGFYALYSHLHAGMFTVSNGATVRAGQTIGHMGGLRTFQNENQHATYRQGISGNSSAPHLHLEFGRTGSPGSGVGMRFNPMLYLRNALHVAPFGAGGSGGGGNHLDPNVPLAIRRESIGQNDCVYD